MLAPAVLAVIGATILVTSFISGIFGMAGGLILLGVLLLFMDVAPAMVLFGTIQTASNGWRAALWLQHVDWGIVWRYLVGSTADVSGCCARWRSCRARRCCTSGSASFRSRPICCRNG